MSLYIDNIIDPLAVIKEGRELSFSPQHFVRMPINQNNTKAIKDWIWKNLVGRFCITTLFVAFEDPSEASMFALISDQLK